MKVAHSLYFTATGIIYCANQSRSMGCDWVNSADSFFGVKLKFEEVFEGTTFLEGDSPTIQKLVIIRIKKTSE